VRVVGCGIRVKDLGLCGEYWSRLLFSVLSIGLADSSAAVRNAILRLIVNANGLEVGMSA
jgi:hypothetical protein